MVFVPLTILARARELRRNGFRHGFTVDKLALPAAGDQPGLAEDSEVMGNRCGSEAAHGNDFAAGHVIPCRDSFEDLKARLVCQGFGYFFDSGAVHAIRKCSRAITLPPESASWPAATASGPSWDADPSTL